MVWNERSKINTKQNKTKTPPPIHHKKRKQTKQKNNKRIGFCEEEL